MTIATASMRAFGSTATVAVTDPGALRDARRLLVGMLRRLDLACSRFRADSELVALNRAAGTPIGASALLRALVRSAVYAAETTEGLVDPTLGRSLRLAGYDESFVRLALRNGSLERLSFEPGGRWREVEVDDSRGMIRVPAGVELDLGATAKAVAADWIAQDVASATGAGVLVGIGGDISVAGAVPAGGWVVGIDDDHATPIDRVAAVVALDRGGLASSGTRVRRWRTASGEMHHILDPRTGRPAPETWTTASVAAATCADANTASTAAIVLGDDAPAWLEARGLATRLSRADGSVVTVGGWPGDRAA